MKNSLSLPVGNRAGGVLKTRRDSLKAAAASAAVLAAPAFVRAQAAHIKIGMTAPFTGRFAMAGIGNAAAARMVFEKINASGGSRGASWSWSPAIRESCRKKPSRTFATS